MTRWILIFLLQPALVIAAQDPGSGLEKAKALFKDLKYEKAVEVVESVLRSSDTRPGDLVAAYKIKGLCLSARGKEEEAIESFRRLLAIRPEYNLQADVSPKLAASFYRAKAMSANQAPLDVQHVPPDYLGTGGTNLQVLVKSNPFHLIRKVRIKWWVDGGDPMIMTEGYASNHAVSFKLPDGLQVKVCYRIEALNEFGGVLHVLGVPKPLCLSPVPKVEQGSDKKPEVHESALNKTESDVKTTTPPGGTHSTARFDPDAQDAAKNAKLSEQGKDFDTKHEQDESNWYKSWWFWTAVGVVVAGAAATTTVLLVSGDETTDYRVDICVGCR